MSKFRLAVLVLLVATVIYAVALALSVQAYNEYKRKYIEDYPWIEPWIDFRPFWDFSLHKYYFMAGIVLMVAWSFTVSLLKNRVKKAVAGTLTSGDIASFMLFKL